MAQRIKPQSTKQRTENEQDITQQTSLEQVNLLLTTGLSCISYLRGLFNDENFVDASISAPRPIISSLDPPTGSQLAEKGRTGQSNVKIKKLIKGISASADRLVDCIEIGAADAIRNSYLRNLTFSIYLDPAKPYDLIECYTFSFTYDQVDEAGNKRPEMVVADKLRNIVLSTTPSRGSSDKSGRVKENDVKRQVQKLIKSVIVVTQSLDELPRRRFMNLRLFYNDDCPDDYEPPLFSAIDVENSPYNISTSNVNDAPGVNTIGRVSTGYHGVSLTMCSIAPTLPESFPSDSATPEECLAINRSNAVERTVLWDAQKLMKDVDFDQNEEEAELVPIGIRMADGGMMEIDQVRRLAEEKGDMRELAEKVGLREIEVADPVAVVSKKNGSGGSKSASAMGQDDNDALRHARATVIDNGSQMQDGQSTQIDPIISRQKSTRPPVPHFDDSSHSYSSRRATAQVLVEDTPESGWTGGNETLLPMELDSRSSIQQLAAKQGFPVKSMTSLTTTEEHEETQLLDFTQTAESLTTARRSETVPFEELATNIFVMSSQSQAGAPRIEQAIAAGSEEIVTANVCDCGDSSEYGEVICCEGCDIWKHAECYGYVDVNDKRIPEIFKCYPCRVTLAATESLLNPAREGEITRALTNLRGLALFRRSIGIVSRDGVLVLAIFAKKLGVDAETASQCLKRLKTERFLIEEAAPPRNGRGGRRKAPQVIVNNSREQLEVKRSVYFNPGAGAELGWTSLLGTVDEEGEMTPPAKPIHQLNAFPPSHNAQSITRNDAMETNDSILDDSSHFVHAQQRPEALKRFDTVDDDPIEDSETEDRRTGEGGRDGNESFAKSSSVMGGKVDKGKGKEVSRSETDRMDADDAVRPSSTLPTPKKTPNSRNQALKRHQEEIELDSQGAPSSKKQKCSEAGEIETQS